MPGGRLGLRLELEQLGTRVQVDPHLTLFGETNGCLLAEVGPTDAEAFERQMKGLPWKKIGVVGAGYSSKAKYNPKADILPDLEPCLLITVAARPALSVSLDAIVAAWLPGERKV